MLKITFIRYVSGITFIRYISGITFIRYAQNLKIGKPNNIKVFGSTNAKGYKQDSQCQLRSHMSE
jgi:hypothetical protein